jgi:pathogenesis-related protein 1
VVDAWGNEVNYYSYADNSCSGVCGHYTQLVWQSTREVGCAMAVCGDKAQIWVCTYHPAGNFVGQKPY